MPRTFRTRFIPASLFIFAVSVVSVSLSYGARDPYLKLKGSNGKSYICTPDASGKFTFSNVEPGTYKLLFAGPPEIFEAAVQKGNQKTIEIQSFSWGATNSGFASPPAGGSKDREGSIPSVSEVVVTKPSVSKGVTVAAGDVNGDSRADLTSISSPKPVSYKNPKVEGSDYCTVVLDKIVITATCSPSGKVSGWNLKENVK